MKRNIGIALVVAAVALAIPYFAFDRETTTLTQTTRSGLSGSFVALTGGVTHYEWQGPESGPPVVLVHGFSTPMFIWDNTVPALTSAGFRVLRYDLFGRGFSDRPEVEYGEDLFDRQLIDLLAALEIKVPVKLVGLSMGGAIATIFAARHPDKVDRLVLIAPAGFPVTLPFTSKLVRLPVIGDYLMKAVGDRSLIKSARKALYAPEAAPGFLEEFEQQLAYKGYKRAIVSTLNHFDLHNQQAAFETAGRHSRPVLLIWGKQDAVIPFAHSARVKKAMPRAQLVAVQNAGHVCPYESPGVVNAVMVAFLQQ